MEVELVEKYLMNRKEWKEMIQNRMKFLQSFDEQKGKKYKKKPQEVDIIERSKEKKTNSDVFMKDEGDFLVQKQG